MSKVCCSVQPCPGSMTKLNMQQQITSYSACSSQHHESSCGDAICIQNPFLTYFIWSWDVSWRDLHCLSSTTWHTHTYDSMQVLFTRLQPAGKFHWIQKVCQCVSCWWWLLSDAAMHFMQMHLHSNSTTTCEHALSQSFTSPILSILQKAFQPYLWFQKCNNELALQLHAVHVQLAVLDNQSQVRLMHCVLQQSKLVTVCLTVQSVYTYMLAWSCELLPISQQSTCYICVVNIPMHITVSYDAWAHLLCSIYSFVLTQMRSSTVVPWSTLSG